MSTAFLSFASKHIAIQKHVSTSQRADPAWYLHHVSNNTPSQVERTPFIFVLWIVLQTTKFKHQIQCQVNI